jgi:hypothetical protein
MPTDPISVRRYSSGWMGTTDGVYPRAGLVFDTAGNLYGTATGGPHGGRVVFEIVP